MLSNMCTVTTTTVTCEDKISPFLPVKQPETDRKLTYTSSW